jgi:hypothetical protein
LDEGSPASVESKNATPAMEFIIDNLGKFQDRK